MSASSSQWSLPMVKSDLTLAGDDSIRALRFGGTKSPQRSGFELDDPLPQKEGNKVPRFLEHNFFSAYRRIFSLIFVVNMSVLVALLINHQGSPLADEAGTAASINLVIAIFFRQENFVNLIFRIFTSAPLSSPLWIRKQLALVYHYGGTHSGAGVAAVAWYILYTVLTTIDFVRTRDHALVPSLVTSYILLAMFAFILIAAHPSFRARFHDSFEAVHRFAGWTVLATFWVHVITSTKSPRPHNLIRSSSFWSVIIITICIVLSWLRLRKRDVYPEVLSDHAIRLHFKYEKNHGPYYGVKLSYNPLVEWHAFATIPDEDQSGRSGFSMVVSNAGDWTRRTIQNPPTKLWVRSDPLYGLLIVSRLFKKVVVVATGSGIGPFLSVFWANEVPRRILWSTPHPEETYGPGIINAVVKADPKAIIWNTRKQGRPDMVALTYSLVSESGAEAVFIISNPAVTKKVVYGMKTRGIPAYGAIFDS